MNFEHVILEPEQQDLFIRMVENVRSLPRENRSPMIEANSNDGTCLIMPKGEITGYAYGDPDALAATGLLHMDYGSSGSKRYIISPIGYKYYDWLMKQQGKPVERIEKQTFRYLEFEDFRKAYPDAYRKVKQAEEMLWSADKEEQFTTIGHLCREAVQDFADSLYKDVMGVEYDGPKTQTNNRIETVITETCDSKKVRKYLRSLLEYGKAVGGLIQKQEHRAEKEKEQLTWEDTRRVVFQAVNVMVELDRKVGKRITRYD
jgi:hypothetical protein